MFWRLVCQKGVEAGDTVLERVDGRFVLHRHHDEAGPHLDMRLEETAT